jgi:hypothetical protein
MNAVLLLALNTNVLHVSVKVCKVETGSFMLYRITTDECCIKCRFTVGCIDCFSCLKFKLRKLSRRDKKSNNRKLK